ncbi:MAG: glycosyltransferase family 2 protein [Chloracidobacterium sp.]|nr:glycosyltransferase family 2 protein [Chloracidobacterium sp.]
MIYEIFFPAVFIAAVMLIFFIIAGYPAVMFAISRLWPRHTVHADLWPRVSLIIAARNEQRDIAAKLENALALHYPKDLLQIIVASDCSEDGTDKIVEGFADRGVSLNRQNTRSGKTRAQYRAARVSNGDILVFSDATTILEPDSLRKMLRAFADPSVGCVAGRLVYRSEGPSAVATGCISYWDYESQLKSWESRAGSLVGVSGCFYAVRRSCHAELASDMIDDFVIATEMRLRGLRSVYEPEAVCSESANHRSPTEFRMRVRVIEQTMNALERYNHLLNESDHGMFKFQIFCHKTLRYSLPLILLLAFVANSLALGAGVFYECAFFGQVLFYLLAIIGWRLARSGVELGPLALPYYFVLINTAAVFAFVKFMRGESQVVWEPLRD